MSDGDLRKIFRLNLPKFDWLAVETGATSRGVPDSNFCYKGREGWVEMKRAKGLRVSVSPEQVAWAERRIRHGGRVFCAVRKIGILYLYNSWALRRLASEPIGDVESVGHWSGGQSRWDWEAIGAILTS
jgi:hypothetical protein